MDMSLRHFVNEVAGAVAGALLLVIVVAFLSIPHHLRGNDGEAPGIGTSAGWHLT
jgi:hypothetical protein